MYTKISKCGKYRKEGSSLFKAQIDQFGRKSYVLVRNYAGRATLKTRSMIMRNMKNAGRAKIVEIARNAELQECGCTAFVANAVGNNE